MNRRPAYLLTAALLVASFTASLYAWHLTDGGVARERHARFVREVDAVRQALQERLRVHLEALHALRALYERGEVDRSSWTTFCRTLALEHRFPGLHRLSFNRRLTRAEVPAFEARLRADQGLAAMLPKPLAVRPIPHAGTAPPADELFVIEHCWPLTGELPVGVDVYADPVRREVIDRLRHRSEPLATPRVTFYPTGSCFVVMMNVAPRHAGDGRDGVLGD